MVSPLSQKITFAAALTLCLVVNSLPASAITLNARFGWVEETDDTLKPSTGLEVRLDNDWAGNLVYWGRDFGPVKERRYQISGYKRFQPFSSKLLSTSIGATLLHEVTSISYAGANSSFDQEDREYNIGGFFGAYASFVKSSNYTLEAYWESSIFPAGQAVLLLVTGRKQAIGLNFGVTL